MEMPAPRPEILARKAEVVRRLSAVLPSGAVISAEAEVRAYECDALTAYRCPPLCAVLPSSTEEVAGVLRVCHELGVPVVPRGAGTSLAGGALPTADSVILGVARMTQVLETDFENRFIRVQTGRTNLSRADVYALLSICGDLRISQVVNGVKGAHVMLAKAHLHGEAGQ